MGDFKPLKSGGLKIAAITKKINMKLQNKLYLFAMTAAALSLSAASGVGQVFSYADIVSNQAIAASPRGKEAFPWFLTAGNETIRSQATSAKSKSKLDMIKENSALAASPRMKELYPELQRSTEESIQIAPLK